MSLYIQSLRLKADECNRKAIARAIKHGVPYEDLADHIYELFLTQKTCGYCGWKFNKFKHITIDHKIAMGIGGGHVKGNIIVCCRDCNKEKNHTETILCGIKQLSTVR